VGRFVTFSLIEREEIIMALRKATSSARTSILGAAGRPSQQRDEWGRRCFVFIATLVCFFIMGLQQAQGQANTASIAGVVTDPSGAAIPQASVAGTNLSNGFTYRTATSGTGVYVLENLPPATYRITVAAPGFEQFARSNITLVVGQRATVDAEMKVGSSTQTVTVTAAAPLLQMQDASTGQNIGRADIDNMPVYGRDVWNLAYLTAGVVQAPGAAYGTGGSNDFISNGGRSYTDDVLVDGEGINSGMTNGTATVGPMWTPSEDDIQEFTIEQNNFSADKGAAGNSIVNVTTRSGTNQFHGTAYEFLQNSALNANDWFSNRAGIPLPVSRNNNFGATAGGPMQKNKMFFFAHYEGIRSEAASGGLAAGVPSAAERKGDFGEICTYAGGTFNAAGACSVANGQLWDPYTAFHNSGTGERNLTAMIPFNNMATYTSPGSPLLAGTPYALPANPGNLISPVALAMFGYYPSPNLNVGNSSYNPYDNWAGSGANPSATMMYDIRIDRQISDMTHFTAHMGVNSFSFHTFNAWNNPMNPGAAGPGMNGAVQPTVALTHNFSPTFLVTASYGYTRFSFVRTSLAKSFPSFDAISALGLPAYMATSGTNAPPMISLFGGYTAMTGGNNNATIGYQGWSTWDMAQEVHNPLVRFSKIVGPHDFEFGGEARVYRVDWRQPGVPSGWFYGFSQAGTSQTEDGGTGGDAMASFLTGLPGPGMFGLYEYPFTTATQNWEYGAYFQDNWHVRRNLTLNLGLRYDLYLPGTDRHNEMDWFDPKVVNPVSSNHFALDSSAAAVLSNAGLPVPDLSTIYGGYEYAGVNGNPRTYVNTNYWGGFAPRFGFAYNLRHDIVLRGGYGIFHDSPFYTTHGTADSFGNNGYLTYTPWLTSWQGNGYTPAYSLSNPFPGANFNTAIPGGILFPSGNSLGLLTELGNGLGGIMRSENQLPYSQEWNLGVQHQFGSVLLDVEYVGTKGTHLYFDGAGSMSYLGPQALSYTPAQIAALETQVDNPFYGKLAPGSSLNSSPTAPAVTFIQPFPASGGVSLFSPPWSNSNYNALQVKVEKRFSRGLEVLANYTWSKFFDDSDNAGTTFSVQDPNNLRLQYSLAQADVPQVLNLSYIYHLPFGRGQQIGNTWNPVVNAILGGWQTQGIWRFDDGQPMGLSSNSSVQIPTWGAQQPNLSGNLKRNNGSETSMVAQYFSNPEVATLPAPYTLGNAPRLLNVFAPGTKNANLSVFKEFSLKKLLGEEGRLQFRIETFNALNHVQFGYPNTTVGSGSFGLVTYQANSPRLVQIAGKVYW
jgi:hypothetical protein